MTRFNRVVTLCTTTILVLSVHADALVFPGASWETREAADLGLDEKPLLEIETLLGGRGCIVKDGYVIRSWGDRSQLGDWLSSSKPVMSTLLFCAVQEGKIKSVDTHLSELGWELSTKDRRMTFWHLANMISGYRRSEAPGAAFAYNDFAIQLYQLTLFDRVFQDDPVSILNAPHRLGPLGFEDGIQFTNGKRRIKASVRDFSRIAWFWLNKGNWNGRQLIERRFIDKYMRPQVPSDLPHTADGELDDYLGIGSYGGGSDHFTRFGPGIYGMNWWFNATGRTHPETITWPDAPSDTFMSIGARGNCTVMMPSLNLAIIAAEADWGELDAGNPEARMNHVMRLAVQAVQSDPVNNSATHDAQYRLEGELKKWHTVTLSFNGPYSTQTADDPNPFLDYRLQVRFQSPSGKVANVPGFFDGDGKGDGSGSVWKVRFIPDEAGSWRFSTSFRQGSHIAIDLNPAAGTPVAFDSCTGKFSIQERDENAPGFLKWGRLEYNGRHFLKFADGPYWLKGGTDSPEDFLAYKGFRNTPRATHDYTAHVQDWQPGDPDWDDGEGKGIIGALNYLAARHVNSIYFMPMNIGGDGKNVWPFAGKIDHKGHPENDNLHYDIEKLYQWELVFTHAQRLGIVLHCVLNEAEENNKRELDDTMLGTERKLYYRELIARFGHHLALQWNLCEEYNLNIELAPELIKEFAAYIQALDPYRHPITVHHAGEPEQAIEPFLGDPLFTVTSFQTRDISIVEKWRKRSMEAGVPQVIGMDEFFPDKANAENADRHRMDYIWPIYLSGGQVEFILDELLDTNDFRRYEAHWNYLWYARRFMQELPFWDMVPRDDLLLNDSHSGDVFLLPGKIAVVFLPQGEASRLDLRSFPANTYTQRWYDPRSGEYLGTPKAITGGTILPLSDPPTDPEQDWVVVIR